MVFDPTFDFVPVVIIAQRAPQVVEQVGFHRRSPPRIGEDRRLRRFVPAERRKERREERRVIFRRRLTMVWFP